MKGGEGKGDERGECGSVCVWGGGADQSGSVEQ